MVILKDEVFYDKDPETGIFTFKSCVRPSIRRNDLGPLPTGALFEILVKKNDVLVVGFQYTVSEAVPVGRALYCAATFDFMDRSDSFAMTADGETIICKDVQVYKEDVDTGDKAFDYVGRPRNIRRDGLGPFVVGDVVVMEVKVNGEIFDSLQYTVKYPVGEGRKLVGVGSVDFVEMNAPTE